MRKVSTIFLIITLPFFIFAEIKVRVKKIFEIGNQEKVIERIGNVAEDKAGNLYVLDERGHKVIKYSPEGKFLISFGQRGEGPGDLKRPFEIYVSDADEIIVTEMRGNISYFDTNGKYQRKFNISVLGHYRGIMFAGGENFFCISEKLGKNSLVLVNLDLKILNSSVCKITEGKSFVSGELEFSLSNRGFVPYLYSANNSQFSAACTSDQYKIIILNLKGHIVKTLFRRIDKKKLTSKEREFLVDEIKARNNRYYTPEIKKGLAEIIPRDKNIIGGLAMTEKYILIQRVKDDLTKTDQPSFVDIYSIMGKYLAKCEFMNLPIYITEKHFYTKEQDDDDNTIIIKYEYLLDFID